MRTPTQETELQACLALLPVLTLQLRDALREANAAIVQVSERFQRIGANVSEVANAGDEGVVRQLMQDVTGAVMALQFDDRLSQRVGYVVRALERIHELTSPQSPAGPSEKSPSPCDLLARIPCEAPEPGDVELF